jgi:large subunit ribosomal protein L15
MRLNEITDRAGARKAPRRLGRGIGSGRGKTAGRGHNGQKSRSGVALKGFEGGQMPIHRRVPKRGFNNPTRKRLVAVNLERLQQAIDAGRLDPAQAVTEKALSDAGVVNKVRDGVRLLANGELKAKLSVEVHGASKAAIAAVEAAGGKITITATPKDKTDRSAKRGRKGKKALKAKAAQEAQEAQKAKAAKKAKAGADGSKNAAGDQDGADAGGPDDA